MQLYHYVSSGDVKPMVEAPTFTPDGGEVTAGTTVALACATEGATIYYAINATDPETATGTAYSAPIALSETCTVTAWAEKEGMTASSRVTKNFTVRTESATEYKKANAVLSGQKYLLVAAGKMAKPVAPEAGKNYGWMEVADVTETDGVISLYDATNAFTFAEIEGGYTIQDSNGKYLYMNGSYNSFNLSETLPATGGVWSVERQSDGTFKVMNVEKGKYIQYDSSYGTFGSYSNAKGDLPVLYTDGNVGEVPSLQEQTLTFPATAYTATMGEAFEAPTVSGAQTTVVYSSSDTRVAEVDATTGAVTLVAAGQTVITATATADATYASASASYTLTVVQKVAGVALPYMQPVSGGKADFPSDGFTQKGLDDDYADNDNNLNCRVKFNTTGDNLTMTLADAPATLSYYIRWNAGGDGFGSFDVETSVDGVNYTSLKNYSSADFITTATDKNEIHIPLSENVRYIRWTYTQKVGGNIGLGAIFVTKKDGETALPMNISSAEYATFYTDKAYIMPEGVTGGFITVSGEMATLGEEYPAGSIVPANTPLLLHAAAGNYSAPLTACSSAKKTGNLLEGTLTNDVITAPAGTKYYIFANDATGGLGFYFQGATGDGSSVKNLAGKAYLAVTGEAAALVKGFRLKGLASGIESAPAAEDSAAPIYTLGGVCVGTDKAGLPKGIYIVGGKKILVK